MDQPTAHPQYWKVKTAELEFNRDRELAIRAVRAEMQEKFERECQRRVDILAERRRLVFEEAGLDSTKAYAFDNLTESITEA